MKNTYNLFIVLLLSVAIISCSTKKGTDTEKVTTANVKQVVEKEFNYPIPTSFEVTTLLQDADAAFVLDITNPVENVDKYETQRDKALNLGIYGADLSYASTYNMNEQTLEFLDASKTLIDGLDVPGIFNEDMLVRVQENMDNRDSLILIVTESFYNTYEQLNKLGQDKLSFLVISASWIEGLYITTQLAVSSDYDERIMAIVAQQKGPASILVDTAEKYKDDEDIQAVAPLLNFMKLTYEGVDPAVGITKGQLDDITANVESTRNEIVD